MKKFLAAALVIILMLTLCLPAAAFPASKVGLNVPYGDFTPDGNINPADYSAKLTLTEDISHVWSGDFIAPVDFYFAWSEKGLYVAVDVPLPLEVKNDSRTTHGDNADRPQISINPGNMFNPADVPENNGYFFTFTVGTDDKVCVTRDNVAGNALGMAADGKDDGEIPVTGGFSTRANGWSIETLIPWSEIDINGTNLNPAPGMTVDFNIFYCEGGGCWGSRLADSENPWGIADCAFTMNFLAQPEPEPEPTPDAAPAEETPAPAAPAPAPAPAAQAPQTGDGMVIFAALALAAAAVVVVKNAKKNKAR